MLEIFSANPWLVAVAEVALVPLVGIVCISVCVCTRKIRLARFDFDLKRDMLQRGLSVEEIERLAQPPVKVAKLARKIGQSLVDVAVPPAEVTEIMAAFRAYQVQYIDRLRQSNGIDLARARVRSPGAAWLRIPLGSGFAVMVAHERRHLWQARKITGAPAFPAGT